MDDDSSISHHGGGAVARIEDAATPSASGEDAVGQSRERFIAVLAHELINPLHAVFANSDLLERKLTDPALSAAASRIKTNVRRMSSMIDDVLDFARSHLGAGIGLKLTDERDIQTALHDVVREFQDAQPHRKIVADISVGGSVRCDIRRLQQVASNLLGNALTYGRSSSPVMITAVADAQDLLLKVWNAGEPIPPEYLDRIFEPFWRPPVEQGQNGLGLGLYICAAIVHAHEGRISVTSTEEQGTEITVRFPHGRPRMMPPQDRSTEEVTGDLLGTVAAAGRAPNAHTELSIMGAGPWPLSKTA